MERTCNKCGLTKPIDQFKPDKTCANGYRWACLECFRASQKARHDANKGKPEYRAKLKAARRRHDLKRKYGLSPEHIETMLRASTGCRICGTTQAKRLSIDHCHATGKVRGLLCTACNNGLGLFRDDPKLLRKAANYLLSSRGDRSSVTKQMNG